MNQARLKLFDPLHPYLHKYVDRYEYMRLLTPVYRDGALVYDRPSLEDIREYHKQQIQMFWAEYLRKTNPEPYHVDFSEKAWQLKRDLIEQYVEEKYQMRMLAQMNDDDDRF